MPLRLLRFIDAACFRYFFEMLLPPFRYAYDAAADFPRLRAAATRFQFTLRHADAFFATLAMLSPPFHYSR